MGQMMGYARVSTPEQDVSLQRDALHQVGCREEHVFLDIASGARTSRPGLAACLQALAPGDTLVVWRLDRLGRSMTHLVTLIDELLRRQIRFRSLCDGALDTTTASGELVFHILSLARNLQLLESSELSTVSPFQTCCPCPTLLYPIGLMSLPNRWRMSCRRLKPPIAA